MKIIFILIILFSGTTYIHGGLDDLIMSSGFTHNVHGRNHLTQRLIKRIEKEIGPKKHHWWLCDDWKSKKIRIAVIYKKGQKAINLPVTFAISFKKGKYDLSNE